MSNLARFISATPVSAGRRLASALCGTALLAVIMAASSVSAAHATDAAGSGGLDTPLGVSTLPLSVEGVPGIMITANPADATLPPTVQFYGPITEGATTIATVGTITEGSTTIATDGTIVIGSNANPQPSSVLTINGKAGIGTATPQATLDVNGDIKIGATSADCSAINVGAVRFNITTKALETCNGIVWGNITGGSYSAGGIDVVYEENIGTFAYCRLPWGAASCDSFGNVSCSRGTPTLTTLSHDNIGASEVPFTSAVSMAALEAAGAQVTHWDCIVN